MVSSVLPTIVEFDNLRQKIEAYLRVYDGKAKSYKEMEGKFEDLFHEDFIHIMSRRPIDKYQLRESVETFLSIGTKAELLLYKPLDDHTFEIKFHFLNHIADSCTHSKGTIKDGKIVMLEAYKNANSTYRHWEDIVELSEVKHNFECFIELQNYKHVSSDDMGEVFNGLFFDSFVAAINRAQLEKRGMRTTGIAPKDFFES
eukprot:801169_1